VGRVGLLGNGVACGRQVSSELRVGLGGVVVVVSCNRGERRPSVVIGIVVVSVFIVVVSVIIVVSVIVVSVVTSINCGRVEMQSSPGRC